MEKVIYFRFDIDTISCIRDGIDPLLQLGQELGLQFTFFANMGKSISRREVLLRSPLRTLGNVLPQQVRKVSAAKKLGLPNVVKTLLLNPNVGFAHPQVLEKILAAGHELGLHGGSNHSTWQRNAQHWSVPQIADAMQATHERFCRQFGRPSGFASPGGNGSALINDYLHSMGYRYVSDRMQSRATTVFQEPSGLQHIPINVQIQQVPVLESLFAQGLAAGPLLAQAVELFTQPHLKTAVGHPCFEGKAGFPLLQQLCRILVQQGYVFRAYKQLLAAS